MRCRAETLPDVANREDECNRQILGRAFLTSNFYFDESGKLGHAHLIASGGDVLP